MWNPNLKLISSEFMYLRSSNDQFLGSESASHILEFIREAFIYVLAEFVR